MTHHLFLASNPSFLLFSEELRVSTIHAIACTIGGRLSQQPTGQSEICNVKCEISPAAPADFFMQNKPNLCVFWDVSGDCEEKQTQFKPNSNPISPRNQRNPRFKNNSKPKTNPICRGEAAKTGCELSQGLRQRSNSSHSGHCGWYRPLQSLIIPILDNAKSYLAGSLGSICLKLSVIFNAAEREMVLWS